MIVAYRVGTLALGYMRLVATYAALLLAVAAVLSPLPAIARGASPPAWRDLTPRSALTGWYRAGGKATFAVTGTELVGRVAPGPANSWLVSEEVFGDFILEFEAKADPALNSGVMVRGQRRASYRDGVVFGYQVEVDPSARRWSGGLYDEQRRGWLYTLARNEDARRAFRSGDWNRYRVEAVGNRVRTFINGVPAADIVDDTDARGFIAFQVHAVPDADAKRGLEVRFRGVRILTETPERYMLPEARLQQIGWLDNALGDGERRAGWRLLWDGRTANGWRSVRATAFPGRGWTMANGVLTVQGGGGDIVTTRAYRDFELSVDFRLAPGANSGIKYLIDPAALGRGAVAGLEYQLLDDERHPDARMGRDGNRTVASLYDLIPARNLSVPGNPDKRVNPPGEWNRATIVVRGNHVEHWLNGAKMVAYERGSPAYRAIVARSKFADMPGFGEASEGAILLQDHGDRVDFRSIKIRELRDAR